MLTETKIDQMRRDVLRMDQATEFFMWYSEEYTQECIKNQTQRPNIMIIHEKPYLVCGLSFSIMEIPKWCYKDDTKFIGVIPKRLPIYLDLGHDEIYGKLFQEAYNNSHVAELVNGITA